MNLFNTFCVIINEIHVHSIYIKDPYRNNTIVLLCDDLGPATILNLVR